MPPPLPLYAFLYISRIPPSNEPTWRPGLSTDKTLYDMILAYESDPDVEFPSFKTTGVGEYTKEAMQTLKEDGGVKVTARGADIGKGCK
jgi:hypothetical protein